MSETKFFNDFCIKYDLIPDTMPVSTIISLLGKYREHLDGVAMDELHQENQRLKGLLNQSIDMLREQDCNTDANFIETRLNDL